MLTEIYLFHETCDGYVANPIVLAPSDFPGRIPQVGDWIIDPLLGSRLPRVPVNQTLLQVVRWAFYPRKPHKLVLIVSERVPWEEEFDVIEALL